MTFLPLSPSLYFFLSSLHLRFLSKKKSKFWTKTFSWYRVGGYFRIPETLRANQHQAQCRKYPVLGRSSAANSNKKTKTENLPRTGSRRRHSQSRRVNHRCGSRQPGSLQNGCLVISLSCKKTATFAGLTYLSVAVSPGQIRHGLAPGRQLCENTTLGRDSAISPERRNTHRRDHSKVVSGNASIIFVLFYVCVCVEYVKTLLPVFPFSWD